MPSTDQEPLNLFRFDDVSTAGRWAIVNDGVMGGVSQSNLTLSDDGTLLFTGTVSLENNGGFASVRSMPTTFDITDQVGVRLKLRGDGKTYKLRFYTPEDPRIAYEAPFETVLAEWQQIDLPFSSFLPTVRGRILTGYDPLDPAAITAVGLFISDNQTGEFKLEVESISAFE